MLIAFNKPSGLSSQGGRIKAHTLDDLAADGQAQSGAVRARAVDEGFEDGIHTVGVDERGHAAA